MVWNNGSSGLVWKLRSQKCHSLAVQASSGKMYDPGLMLREEPILSIGNNAVKFLRAYIQVPRNTQQQDNISSQSWPHCSRRWMQYLSSKASSVQGSHIPPSADLAITWVKTCLEATATSYLKKWTGLTCSADPARQYLPKTIGGLILPAISWLYKKMHVSHAYQLITWQDSFTQHVARLQIEQEQDQQRAKFMLTVRWW